MEHWMNTSFKARLVNALDLPSLEHHLAPK